MPSSLEKRCLLATADIEDWAQSTWDRSLPITERAGKNTDRLLDLLNRRGKRITMFVLGKFAERFPQLVRRITAEGHEVASHGWGHVEIFRQSPEEFRADVTRAKSTLEDVLGSEVIGYRAPDFSIVDETLWALEVLAETGHRYDSSVFPIRRGRYGIPWWPPNPTRLILPSGRSILELPIGTVTVNGRRLPAGGGGYHRLLPSRVIQWAVSRALREQPVFVAYCHPYEFNSREFREMDLRIPLRTRLHQGLGRRGFGRKFEKLLEGSRVVRCRDLANAVEWPEQVLRIPA